MQDGLFTRRRVNLLIILLLLIACLFIGLSVYRSVVFRFVGTSPKTDAVATISPFFKMNFNKPLSQDISVNVSPEDAQTSYSIKGSTITVLFSEPLKQNRQYRISLANISDTKGKHLSDRSFDFIPKIIPSDQLSDDQKQALLASQQRYNNTIQDDGLVKLLPFNGGGNEFQISYTVNYINQKPQLVIVITASTPQGQADGLNWIKLAGFNPANYKITYQNTVADE